MKVEISREKLENSQIVWRLSTLLNKFFAQKKRGDGNQRSWVQTLAPQSGDKEKVTRKKQIMFIWFKVDLRNEFTK